MMNEADIREYRERVVESLEESVRSQMRYCYEARCERLYSLDFILEDVTKPGYVYPQDRFPFSKTVEVAR